MVGREKVPLIDNDSVLVDNDILGKRSIVKLDDLSR
jgi:hypothetical protein